jgi:hypothetical protein
MTLPGFPSPSRAARIRRRAATDAVLVLLASTLAALPVANPHDSLLVATAAVSLGLFWFVVRRNNYVAALAREDMRRREALTGRGLRIADWHRGVALSPWEVRARASGSDSRPTGFSDSREGWG